MRITVTVRSPRPELRAGHRYPIIEGDEATHPGDHHIDVEVDEFSRIELGEDYLHIHDLDTVLVVGVRQVAS